MMTLISIRRQSNLVRIALSNREWNSDSTDYRLWYVYWNL